MATVICAACSRPIHGQVFTTSCSGFYCASCMAPTGPRQNCPKCGTDLRTLHMRIHQTMPTLPPPPPLPLNQHVPSLLPPPPRPPLIKEQHVESSLVADQFFAITAHTIVIAVLTSTQADRLTRLGEDHKSSSRTQVPAWINGILDTFPRVRDLVRKNLVSRPSPPPPESQGSPEPIES
jgi:hypothetical protein